MNREKSRARPEDQEAYYGPDHIEVAMTLNNLGNAYGALGDYKTKKTYLERALRIEEAYYGPDHVEPATIRFNLANCLFKMGQRAQASRL